MKMRLMFAAIFAVSGAVFLSAAPDCGKGSDGKLFPNPDDCSTFYQCRDGGAILQECPEDLHFNPRLETCDWAWAAGCEPEICEDDTDNQCGVIVVTPNGNFVEYLNDKKDYIKFLY